jgi:HPt (histidine-containing phosphotransfer) domain-containing protein
MDSVRASAPSESTPLDVDALLERCLGRIDLAERILQRFQTCLADDVKQLEAAVLTTNTEEIAHLAHRIKGASLAVSAYELTDCAKSLELSATAQRLDDIPAHLARLKQESSRFADVRAIIVDSLTC